MENNKVLLISPSFCLFTKPYLKAIKKSGYQVKIFDNRNSIIYKNELAPKIIRRFPKIKYKIWKRINKQLLKVIDQYQPDLVFAIKAENIYPQTVEKINQKGITTINFYTDYIWEWNSVVKLAPAYQYFFCPDNYVLNLLKKQGYTKRNLHYLTYASDIFPDQHQEPFKDRQTIYDISVVASLGPNIYDKRVRYLENLKDLGLNIWGSNYWRKTSLKNNYRGPATPDQVFDIYKKSKMVINIHYDQEPAEAVNSRPFETAESGALIISDTIRKDIFNVFKVGEEFIPFENEKELREKVIYYLNHDQERIKIAKAAYKRVLREHTYYHRWQKILKVISSN